MRTKPREREREKGASSHYLRRTMMEGEEGKKGEGRAYGKRKERGRSEEWREEGGKEEKEREQREGERKKRPRSGNRFMH